MTSSPAAIPARAEAAPPEPASEPPLLREWIARYGPELRRHAGRMLGSEDEAEDILQQVWLAAARQPPLAGEGSNVRAWLYRAATNAALDRLATERRRRSALAGGLPEPLADEPPAPDERLARLDQRARLRVREHVRRLPPKQREAVWLRWVEGHSYAAIAARLGSSEESARANVYQGMKRLRRELFDLWEQEYRA